MRLIERRQKRRTKIIISNLDFLSTGPTYIVKADVTINNEKRGHILLKCKKMPEHWEIQNNPKMGLKNRAWESECKYVLPNDREIEIMVANNVKFIFVVISDGKIANDVLNIIERIKPDVFSSILKYELYFKYILDCFIDTISEYRYIFMKWFSRSKYLDFDEPNLREFIFNLIQQKKCADCGKKLENIHEGKLSLLAHGAEFLDDRNMWEILCEKCHTKKIEIRNINRWRNRWFSWVAFLSLIVGILSLIYALFKQNTSDCQRNNSHVELELLEFFSCYGPF